MVGIDAPNSLPHALVAEPWQAWIESVRDWPDAAAFRVWCRTASQERELRRACDRQAQTPFCAWNLRLYRQTFHALADLVVPLALSGAASVAPFQPPLAGKPRLAEVCPASTLKRLGLYKPPYKGRGLAQLEARQRILGEFRKLGLVLSSDHEKAAVSQVGGDALDALVAATAVWRCARAGQLELCDPASEGEVYVWA